VQDCPEVFLVDKTKAKAYITSVLTHNTL